MSSLTTRPTLWIAACLTLTGLHSYSHVLQLYSYIPSSDPVERSPKTQSPLHHVVTNATIASVPAVPPPSPTPEDRHDDGGDGGDTRVVQQRARVILHVGPGKTGTSSIQSFLYDKSAETQRILRNDNVYPQYIKAMPIHHRMTGGNETYKRGFVDSILNQTQFTKETFDQHFHQIIPS